MKCIMRIRKASSVLLMVLLVALLNACGGDLFDCSPTVSTPNNLMATANSASQISLRWDYGGERDITFGFNIYRDGKKIQVTGGKTYADYNVLPSTEYCYWVTAKNACGESSASNRNCVTTPGDFSSPFWFSPKSALIIYPVSQTEAYLSWDKPYDNVSVEGYEIYKNKVHAYNATDESFTDTGLSDDSEYCYSIVAYDYVGNKSEPSNCSCIHTSWNSEKVDDLTEVTGGLSLATDLDGNAHIAFYDKNFGYLRYATNEAEGWLIENVDYIGLVLPYDFSITIDNSKHIHIVYVDRIDGTFKYATNQTGGWSTVILDSPDNPEQPVGSYNSITTDSLNKVHVSYFDSGKISYITNVSGTWVKENFSGCTRNSAISVNPNGHVHITCYSRSDDSIKYITNLSSEWIMSTVALGYYADSVVDLDDNLHLCLLSQKTGFNYVTNVTGNWVSTRMSTSGQYCSIAVSNNGTVHISHQTTHDNSVYLSYTTNTLSEWTSYNIDSPGSGWYSSISLDGNDNAHVIHMRSLDDSLNYATNK